MTDKRKPRLFDRIREGYEAALRGEGRETIIIMPDPVRRYAPADVAILRRRLGMTQIEFSHLLNVSLKTVESWEQGLRPPSAASARLLQIVENPDAFTRIVHQCENVAAGVKD